MNGNRDEAGARLLVVDDEPSIVELLSTALRFLGHEVVTANSGSQGLQVALRWQPDLLVLDVMLPDLDGFEVARRLRESGLDVPVVFLTARDEVPNRVKGSADGYINRGYLNAALHDLAASPAGGQC